MTWKEMTKRVGERAGVSEAEARRVLGALVDEVEASLVRDEAVRIPRLGSLRGVWEAERQLRGIRDGRRIVLDGHWRPSFSPAASLRRTLRERTPQLLRDRDHQAAWRLAETLVGDLALYHERSVPKDVTPDLDPTLVETRCRSAFGPAWDHARETWQTKTPPAVRDARDYLAFAARRRWSTSV